jgi:hypothetical protein
VPPPGESDSAAVARGVGTCDTGSLSERIETDSANVQLRIREDHARMPSILESFSDGHIVSLHTDGATMVVGLRMPGAQWPSRVAQVEARLDRLDGDWRAYVTLRRP